ncbi:MAG: ABC transporter permease [Nocardioides sp.]|uniref:ABC transporter permease n=1 Tax=Nocardioides sp. TaxID=35761 RepID=UPI0039E39EE7
MLKILWRWVCGAVPVLLAVSAVTFVLSALVPGNPARTILGASASQAQVAALNKQLGLDEPLPVRYWHWLSAALHGQLGESIITGQSVTSAIAGRIGVTVSLIVGAVAVAAVLGIGLGLISAVRGGWLGKVVDVISLIGIAVPNFWFALVLVSTFAVRLQIFPATGYVPLGQSPAQWLQSLVLPVLTLAIPAAAPVAKQIRDGVLTELGREYVRVLRARGASPREILLKHVLRNAAAPIITMLGIIAVVLLGGTVLAETVFVLPGLGGLAVSSTASHDIPMIQGLTVVFTMVVMVINLVIEFSYSLVNPKVRS